MMFLPAPLKPLEKYPQFILCHLSPDTARPGKTLKIPVHPQTLVADNPHLPRMWMSFQTAIETAVKLGLGYGTGKGFAVGFVLTKQDPFYCVDIDNCFDENGPNATAQYLMSSLPGAAVELSQSGKGLHIFGKTAPLEHSCRNDRLGLELYTSDRFIVLTANDTRGSADVDSTVPLRAVVEQFFSINAAIDDGEWNDKPVAEWQGPDDDDLLLEKAFNSGSAASVFGSKASFKDLFYANVDVLGAAYPDAGGTAREYDASAADAALAMHLAFWTGKNHARILRIMRRSALVRDKWEAREAYYLPRTIRRAVVSCKHVYNNKSSKPAEDAPAEHKQDPAVTVAPLRLAGLQFMPTETQLKHFEGCVYVRDMHKVFVPDGAFLSDRQFRTSYGGYLFAMDAQNQKTEKNAWTVFTESQAIRFPKVHGTTFRPDQPAGAIVFEEGRTMVNVYVPAMTTRREGDVTPFTTLIAKMLPVERDRRILYSYMASMVQNPGCKFQYCVLVQGVEGNGKSTLIRALAHAVGHRYSHMPNARELAGSGGKFTGWMNRKLFIGVEELKIRGFNDDLLEILKPMISNDRLEMQAKGVDQAMADNRSNWLICANYKDAVPVTTDTRRYCIFYCAQQSKADFAKFQMEGAYFPTLYRWLNDGGYAIINHWLRSYAIEDEFDPALLARAPETSSTYEAVEVTRSEIEQYLLEAIGIEFPGFRGGWISSLALDKFFEMRRLGNLCPPNKRRALLQKLGYDWHPGLLEGRCNNAIMAEGGKPKLFCKTGSIPCNLTSPAAIQRAYEEAQGYTAGAESPAFAKGHGT